MTAILPPASASTSLDALLDGIDRGIEAHMAWTQRLLRYALLREPPGDDVLRPMAHTRCQFGVWFVGQQPRLETFDAELVDRVAHAHQQMHEAVCRMCECLLHGKVAAAADLQAYELGQSTMVTLLNRLRELVAKAAEHRDELTGLPLRHGLEYTFDLRCKDARRAHEQLWLAMIDVDRFKSVNDSHGHAAGDLALQGVARRLGACMREADTLLRFGGEEFLALFMVNDVHDVELLAARLLDAVSATPLTLASGVSLPLSVTIGLARAHDDDDLGRATDRADQALLLGKAQGRNRYVLAQD